MTDEEVEIVARALQRQHVPDTATADEIWQNDSTAHDYREGYRADARAAITALDACRKARTMVVIEAA